MFLHTTAVPEPSAYVLFLIGGTVGAVVGRRKRTQGPATAELSDYDAQCE